MPRLPVIKTPKVLVGGAFIRSESGRVFPLRSGDGAMVANLPQCTRKDLRNAVELAAKAGPGWARRTPYNRGQILYRLGEMLESRAAEMAGAIGWPRRGSSGRAAALREVRQAIDRIVHYAGWADKYGQLLGSVNPVSGPFFNFTVTEPMGVVGLIAPAEAPLLGLVSLLAPAIVSGNTVVALASESNPYPAIVLGELLATSDVPSGVVNLLTGFQRELVPAFASHAHLRAVTAVVEPAFGRALALGAAESVKRVKIIAPGDTDFADERSQGLDWIRALVECKTTWHPIGA
jgi:acyl-CoA reductase-like NAD-dependent aldehyde dehydrogenase